ncbi:esterase [Paramagnetospirillum marisnigri]|uniref:Esterase n=1 Tax=Paramagnetospirillum marisnigri TaxID=1285242 RepID=A0A178MTI0_9PROT|nr:esterase [Paramagnetospirillum marisnigri]
MHILVLATLAASLTACAAQDRSATAESIAATAGLRRVVIKTGPFDLTAYVRVRDPAQPVVVYVEGDGAAWRSRSEPSQDPTPRHPMGLRLAGLDRSPNVAYLARPCQYSWGSACKVAYWTDRRFAEEVIAATSTALDQLKATGGFHLVGYSGGAAVAALAAARRSDVLSLRSVAGNLDSEGINRHHGVSAMPASLNPIDVAPRLAHLPQTHLVGGDDKVVPPFIAEDFVSRLGDKRCVTITRLPKASHDDGWESVWPAPIPICRSP